MKVLEEIKDMLEDELKKISKKEDITTVDLENIYKMVDIVKDVSTIDAMKKAEEQGYSRDYSRDNSRGYSEDYSNAYGSYRSYDGRRGRDGDSDGRYSEDGSYRRGRDSMGRYTCRDGSYASRDGSYEGSYNSSYEGSYDGRSGHSKEQMIEHLTEMMRNARNEDERESYRRAIEQMRR